MSGRRPPDRASVTRTPRASASASRRPRPDGVPKVQGEFAFAGDLWAEGMLWGHTLRSPHPSARILGIDIGARAGASRAWPRCSPPTTCPGATGTGSSTATSPCSPTTSCATRASRWRRSRPTIPRPRVGPAPRSSSTYEVLEPVIDPVLVTDARTAPSRRQRVPAPGHPPRRPRDATVRSSSRAPTRSACRTRRSWAPRPGSRSLPTTAVSTSSCRPSGCTTTASRWPSASDCPEEKVRLTLAGVGGAFGAREDVSLQIHLVPARPAHRPTGEDGLLPRRESFLGHVHRHPARIWYRHSAEPDGTLVELRDPHRARRWRLRARRRSTSPPTPPASPPVRTGCRTRSSRRSACAPTTRRAGRCAASARCRPASPTRRRWTSSPHALRRRPVELRLRNALAPGDELLTGQRITGTLPVAEVIRACAALPGAARGSRRRARPVPAAPVAPRDADRRSARRRLRGRVQEPRCSPRATTTSPPRGARSTDGVVTVTCACAEVGQGFVTLVQQFARDVLGVDDVVVTPADTSIGSAGSTSASRQTWMSGGAVEQACRGGAGAGAGPGGPRALPVAGRARRGRRARRSRDGAIDLAVVELFPGETFEETDEYHHQVTHPLDDDGQGDAHVSFAFAAHRAVVDVDAELGLVRVVDLATAQDVGQGAQPAPGRSARSRAASPRASGSR